MNYKKMLYEYMRHVGNVESTDYIDEGYGTNPDVTPEELEELRRMSKELTEEWRRRQYSL